MAGVAIHRFERNGRRFAIDPESCFCFECDAISWDVLEHYPHETIARIVHLLGERYDPREIHEVIGELEWLRATKSILRRENTKEMEGQFRPERGLKRVTLRLPAVAPAERRTWFAGAKDAPAAGGELAALGRDAAALLLNRSGQQRELTLVIAQSERFGHEDVIVSVMGEAVRAAALAEKTLRLEAAIDGLPLERLSPALQDHALALVLDFGGAAREDLAAAVKACARADLSHVARIAKAVKDIPGVRARIVLRPRRADFAAAVEELRNAGFTHIEIDIDGALAADSGLDPAAMMAGLHEAAGVYANQLLRGTYYRLDPIADLFWRIYEGKPMPRADGAGVTELTVDADGAVYPEPLLAGREEFRAGRLSDGTVDGGLLARFDNVGSATTGVCRRCWARNLCGGGRAAVHHALTGSIRTPEPAWCAAQREWMQAAVSAFNVLSSNGVNFARMYQSLQPNPRPSMLTMVRAALSLTVVMRPIEEADAPMLVQWENWTEAAYFLFNETGLLLATHYDREMDSLHPSGFDLETMLARKDGSPVGLLKVRPGQTPGTATAWMYIRNPADRAAADIRKGVKTLLVEAAKHQQLRRLTVFALESESGLHGFLEAIGFVREGVQREAVFLHGGYFDVAYYGMTFPKS